MRDLLLQLAVYAGLPLAIYRPYWGLLIYSWLTYMRPQELAWGVTKEMPLSQLVAVATIVGLLVALRRERLMALRPQTFLLLALFGWISLSVWSAVLPELAATVYGHYWKAILIALLTTGLVRSRERLRWLLCVIAFSIGVWGVKFGLFGLLRGGTRFYDGPGGMMGDNNSFAVVLSMVVPLLVGIAMSERSRALRIAAAATAALCVLTVLFTFSRSGLLSLLVVGTLLVLRSRHRALTAVVLAVALAGFVFFSSDTIRSLYADRAVSILEYEEDQSVRARFVVWQTCWRVFQDYPLLGVGPDNLQAVYWRYSSDPERFRVAHNAGLQLLSESGLPALLLFIATLGTALWRLEVLRRRHAGGWPEVYARVLQIAIAGYLTGSMFLNLAYLELIFHLVGLSVSLELAAASEAGAEAGAAASPAVDAWWRRPAPAVEAG